jgi:hypothetical protein
VSARKSRTTDQSLNALRVVGEIVAEELDTDDPRLAFIKALPGAWDKQDRPRWDAARHMLDHDTDYAGEPPLRIAALGLLVEINDALADFFSGTPCDKRRAARRACQLRAMVDHLAHIVEATTREYLP